VRSLFCFQRRRKKISLLVPSLLPLFFCYKKRETTNRKIYFEEEFTLVSTVEIDLPAPNQQNLDIRSTPREEMNLYPLDTFPYEFVGRKIKIQFEMPEFTAICPFSDFPDFATIRLEYVPNEHCIELKSLKLYINSFREVKIFHEHVINVILEDFVRACDPLKVEIEGDFNVRGNIKTTVRAKYKRENRDAITLKQE
jgi:7-cyano-7-deazaguanine reductase